MISFNRIYDPDNLQRAWRWIRSNADASYKAYNREIYSCYSIADEALLADLRDRLRRNVYEPEHACKIYFPKSSGILRPYTLLSVEDQIVYQALINVVAELLYPRVRRRYNKEVFGHLYAGKSSVWFYRKWSNGYAKFNSAAREAFDSGYNYTASFDLTACYDSLDHGVLSHFLAKLGCDQEIRKFLVECLSRWTATNHRIYHNHGIPQGPLSSGLLSEVVLRHFDEFRGRQASVKYFRYVDDIRLFAKDERRLREMLVRLDMLSKDIGLFPQSAKISIHRVKDIETELKTISNPVEPTLKAKIVDQRKLHKRITALSKNFDVSDPTRFKYLLANAAPDSRLTNRLWRIFDRHPEYYKSIAMYLSNYDTLPRKASERLIEEVRTQRLYSAIPAAFVDVLCGRVHPSMVERAKKIIAGRWKPRSLQPELFAAIGRWQLHYGQFSFKQMETACKGQYADWSRTQVCLRLDDEQIGKPSLESLTNRLLRDNSLDVAICATSIIRHHELVIERPTRDIHRGAKLVLKELGLVRRGPGHVCAVATSFKRFAGVKTPFNWKKFFGADYRQAERQAVICRALADTNVSAWVNAFDVFIDLILIALYRRDHSLGTYAAGRVGSVMNSTRLTTSYPAFQQLVKLVHEKRYESNLSHAKQRRSGKATKQIKYSFLTKTKPLLRKAVSELAR